jgi:excisionase family DNA binding protein
LADEGGRSGRPWCENGLASVKAETVRQAEQKGQRLPVVPLNTPPPRWLSTRQAAAYLGLTRTALEKRIERRQIPYSKLGANRRFDIRVLDRMLENSSNERSVLPKPLRRRRSG